MKSQGHQSMFLIVGLIAGLLLFTACKHDPQPVVGAQDPYYEMRVEQYEKHHAGAITKAQLDSELRRIDVKERLANNLITAAEAEQELAAIAAGTTSTPETENPGAQDSGDDAGHAGAGEPKEVDPLSTLSAYQPTEELRGRIRSIGSDTMDNLMNLWHPALQKHHQSLAVLHEGKGSSTAMPALIEGRSDIGPMSRQVKDSERQKFESEFGYPPQAFRAAVDAIAIYVHPENPIAKRGLDFQQLDAIFSSTRKRGAPKDIVTWGQLGLSGEWQNRPIRVYSRNSASGTFGFFKDTVLLKGNYKPDPEITFMVGSEPLVTAVARDKYAIGYSGIGYRTDEVAVVPLSEKPGEPKVPPTADNAYSEKYPLARYLYLVINHKPGTDPSPLQREFLTFIYSREGQTIVKNDGFFPLSKKIVDQELGKLK